MLQGSFDMHLVARIESHLTTPCQIQELWLQLEDRVHAQALLCRSWPMFLKAERLLDLASTPQHHISKSGIGGTFFRCELLGMIELAQLLRTSEEMDHTCNATSAGGNVLTTWWKEQAS